MFRARNVGPDHGQGTADVPDFVIVGPALPLAEDPVHVLRGTLQSPLTPAEGSAYDEEIVEAMRAAGPMLAPIFAESCAGLLERGWHLELTGYALTLSAAMPLETILEVARSRMFPPGFPLQVGLVTRDGNHDDAIPAGGLLAGYEPHSDLWPTRVLPAIVCNHLTGAQHRVDDESSLRATFEAEMREMIDAWRMQNADFATLPWVQSPRAVKRVAHDVMTLRGGTPAFASLAFHHTIGDPPPQPGPVVSVFSIRELTWLGVEARFGQLQRLPMCLTEGLAAIEIARGKQLELKREPDQPLS